MRKIVLTSVCLLVLAASSPAMAEDAPAPEAQPAVDPNAAVAASTEPAPEPAPAKIAPRKVEVDSNYDGKVDRTEIYDANGQIARIEADSNGDGKVDEWMAYENGRPVESQRDSNGDGKVDVWVEY